jgi:hypothetical protein
VLSPLWGATSAGSLHPLRDARLTLQVMVEPDTLHLTVKLNHDRRQALA